MASGLQPGEVIAGRYEIVERIGIGGFGAVYRARQLEMNREVAIKTLLPHLSQVEGIEERFKREAQLASDLSSPHTIRLYDFGTTESGMLFIAMELLKGEELEKILKQNGPLSQDETISLAIEVLDSLAEAHANGIVHRDLKPSNIFLAEVGRNPRFVKVLDFGIAKAMSQNHSEEEQGEEQQKLTATGQALGTPYYMAPEQIRGKNVGGHTDIYALGLILIEMVTGHVAVQGATPLETVLCHVNNEPIPIPDCLLGTSLGAIVQRATEKKWQNRYQTGEEMIADLEEAKRGGMIHYTPTVQTPQMTGVVVQQAPPSNRGLLIALLVLLILIGVGGAVAFVMFQNQNTGVQGEEKEQANQGKPVGDPVAEGGVADDVSEDSSSLAPQEKDVAGGDLVAEAPDDATDAENGALAQADVAEEANEDATPDLPEVETLSFEIKSRPEGAKVYRDEVELGVTPLVFSQEAGEGESILVLKKEGRRDAEVVIDLAKGGEYDVRLKRKKRKDPDPKDPKDPKDEKKDPRPSLAVD